MADVTKYPSDIKYFQWSRPTAKNPRLAQPLTSSATTIYVTNPPLDEDGKIVADAFIMGIETDSYVEQVYVPAEAVQGYGNTPDSTNIGTTITGVTRGIPLAGLDYTTGSSDLRIAHDQDSPVCCSVHPFHFEAVRGALNGTVASGGENWKIGNEANNDITVYASNGDANEPFWQYDASENKWIYSNDGVSSTPFGTGAGVTGGDGITVTAGDIDVDLTDTTVFKAESAGAGDAGLAVVFDADGYVDSDSVQVLKDITATSAEINQALDGISANVTDTNLNTLTAGTSSDADSIHTHDTLTLRSTNGSTTSANTDVTKVITHNLGYTPKIILFSGTNSQNESNGVNIYTTGSYSNSLNSCAYTRGNGSGGTTHGSSSSYCMIIGEYGASDYRNFSVTAVSSTTFTLTISNNGTVGTSNIQWTVIA